MARPPVIRTLDTRPPELVVYDEPGPCSYLEGRIWRLPLRLPIRSLTRAEFEHRLVSGDRRQGRLLYRTNCPDCCACEPIRIDVQRFVPGRTQRRVLARGNRLIDTELGPLEVDSQRVELYNRHKQVRGLAMDEEFTTPPAYRMFLGESCCFTFELRYLVAGKLLGVAIVDLAEQSLSAVYFYFDPDFGRLSPGVYSIMKQLDLCRQWGLRYLYLGLYVAECPAMSYKGWFLPHQRLIAGSWKQIDRPGRRG